jgi:signal transduction histidine kinase/CheY-like chemotaxis protein
MARIKHLPGYLAVILYAAGAAALATFLIVTNRSDAWLYLLVGPVLFAAVFYPRWVYLCMSLGTLLAAGSVVLYRDPHLGSGVRNVVLAVVLILVNSELLYRMMRGRRRAEGELRGLLDREKEARAQSLAAQERLAFLAGASAALGGSLDLNATLAQVVRQAVPYLADLCIIRVTEGVDGEEQSAAAHADAGRQAILKELQARYGLDLGLPQPDEVTVLPEIRDETLAAAARDEEHLRLLRELSLTRAVVAPLARQEHRLGTLTFAVCQSGRRYSPADVDLARELARRAAVAVENARLHQALQEADRGKVEFLAMLAHELRNPLAAISNAGYLLERRLAEDAHAGRLVSPINRQARHLARLVDDLLEVSRITQGKLELRRETVEVVAATRQAVESVRPMIEKRHHQLHVSVPEERLWIEADPTRYEQVLVNLLVNAAKYTEDGGQIWLSLTLEDSSARIGVRDTGVGLAPELLPRVFDLFTQGDTSPAGARSGLGIGLTLVRRLVELHGGSVMARSEGPGHGSEFIVTFPGARSELGTGQRLRRPRSAAPDGESRSCTRDVLVVDDDRDAVETLCELLEMWGHRVWMARDGARGIEAARAHDPEVVLLDIGMPGMDGYEVARRLRADARTREAVLVALTGYGAEEDRKRSREAGFDYHIVKPVNPEELQRLLLNV